MKTIKTDVLVLGGGITGLHAATMFSQEGLKTYLYSQDFGGLIGSQKLDGFNFDYGGHVYTPTRQFIHDLMMEAGAEKHKRKAIYFGGEEHRVDTNVPYPVQDHPDELGINIEPIKLEKYPQNFEEFLISKFGYSFYTNWAYKFNKRVWTISPSNMDIDWVKDRVKTTTKKDTSWGPNSTFLYAPGDRIVKVLMDRASEAGVLMRDGTLGMLDVDSKTATILQPGLFDVSVEYDWLFSTIPLNSITEYLSGPDPFFLFNRVRTVGVGLIGEAAYDDFHWAYANVARRAHRITLLSRYHKENAPSGKDSYIIEYPYRSRTTLPEFLRPETQFITHVGNMASPIDLGFYTLIEAGIPEVKSAIETVNVSDTLGYPIPTLGVREEVEQVKRKLFEHQIVSAGRWGSHGYFNLDHCIQDVGGAFHVMQKEELTPYYLFSEFYYGKRK